MKLLIEVPAGELMDKITILKIKMAKIGNPDKLVHVLEELTHLTAVCDRQIPKSGELDKVVAELERINAELWCVEDDLRDCERKKEFTLTFIELARAVYHLNDKRAKLKNTVNQLTGSRLIEEKSYVEYEAI